MAASEFIVDPSTLDFSNIIADVEEIRRHNAQRFEMEQLTAIVYENLDNISCAGYKDITETDFWVRGHMPGMPLMPGVVQLEAAAQLCSYFAHKYDLLGVEMLGFGGLEDVRFRDPVLPGDRFVIMCQQIRVRKGRMIVSRFQGFVRNNLVLEGVLKGVPIPVEALKELREKQATGARA